ncbi:Oligopeptide/dipeptide ABC transporter, ATP-binding protein-like protein [Methanospirillum hungatei JF-1]|uniref:Nickel import system ATP-binding protein NikD n=1 Tax=Methanospirillum hungatei JF-1 (strain ATCC 27890 / DSM 864 / NBRC 100397 / JF-1) TaxID=323259 RepID=Q2FL97_METHJ|nr:ABC transporter ATP-binding protein [Methanospirillum hungatei]ABD39978.1 Oligopeptide/dipeptide ABC transporter, ATP-binding protein-like protein [Methanospirillum hungatei JF-1]
MKMNNIIEISDLTVSFKGEGYLLTAVDNLSLSVIHGETLAIIGESGSGKSVLGLAILRLLPDTAAISGSIIFQTQDILTLSEGMMEKIRGGKIAWIPQNPKLGFNPSMKIWKQVSEPIVLHTDSSWSEAKKQAIRLLRQYSIVPPEKWAEEYPVAYSGGMLQRAMLAMGTSTIPSVLIADEPTKGIDAINKKDVIEMFNTQKERGITQIIITHDLDFASEVADRIAVMYCGQIVELTSVERFFTTPLHPYSVGLVNSLPQRGLSPIPGTSPAMHEKQAGCRFKSRCSLCSRVCSEEIPLFPVGYDNVRCIQYHNRNWAW